MRLRRTRRGKTFVDVTPVGEKVRITMGHVDATGYKNTDLDPYEIDQLITMLSYYKLKVTGQLPGDNADNEAQAKPASGTPQVNYEHSLSFTAACELSVKWKKIPCTGLCRQPDHKVGEFDEMQAIWDTICPNPDGDDLPWFLWSSKNGKNFEYYSWTKLENIKVSI